MPKYCTVCEDPRRDEFDRRARIEDNIAKIAQDFALSYDSFYRHIKADHHIREVTAIPTSTELATSGDILREITEHHKEAKRLKGLAEENGDLKTALFGLDKALKCLELVAKIQGQIQTQPQINLTQVSIYNAPEWLAVGDLLARILAPYPELRAEVARELLALEEVHR
jgi:hypothetical protein